MQPTYSQLLDELRGAPFVRLTMPFLLGILWQAKILPISISMLPAAILWFALYIVLQIMLKSHTLRWAHGAAVWLFLFTCGVYMLQNLPKHTAIAQNMPIKLLGVVAEPPVASVKYAKCLLNVKIWQDSMGNLFPASEKAFIYLPIDVLPMPKTGDEVAVSAIFSPIPAPQNPYEFDYAQYARRRQIFSAAFVTAGHYAITDSGKLAWYDSFRQNMRHASIKILENTGIDGEELAVLLTLTLGDRSRLDSDLYQSYAAAGAAHVLAVSGAHVMMIAMVLGCMLSPLKRRRHGAAAAGGIVLLIMWLYALAAGLSPPILRASIMFSAMTIGGMLHRGANPYNNLAFAAMLLCAIDPHALFNTGFLLSFAAVLSIVFFEPRILNLIYVKNPIMHKIWGAASVAIAANVGTFPIIIYTFHQFPVYFVLTNLLIALPVVLILTLFVFIFIFSLIPMLTIIESILCVILKWLIWFVNSAVRYVEGIPGSAADGLWLPEGEAWLLMAAVVLLALLLWTGRRRLVVAVLVCMLCFAAMHAKMLYLRRQQALLAVYSIKKTTLITFFNAEKPFTICDSMDFNNSFDFNTKAHMASLGLTNFNTIPKLALHALSRTNNEDYGIYHGHISYYGKTIAIAVWQPHVEPLHAMPVDILIITSLCKQSPEWILRMYSPRVAVLDASLSTYRHDIFLQYLTLNNIKVHSVQHDGAFLQNIKQ
jgi:competence protein ComEC